MENIAIKELKNPNSNYSVDDIVNAIILWNANR